MRQVRADSAQVAGWAAVARHLRSASTHTRAPDPLSPPMGIVRAVTAASGKGGPPGAGKTFTGARMIIDLVRSGKKVGVTAVSHKVIRNLLEEVVRAAEAEKISVRCMHRVTVKSRQAPPGIEEDPDWGRALKKIVAGEYDVVGATAGFGQT
jgi:hypothetical protein